jgi:hypothetical protein
MPLSPPSAASPNNISICPEESVNYDKKTLCVTAILTLYEYKIGFRIWPEFLVTDPEVPGSIPGAIRFSEIVGLERGLISLVRITEELFT